MALSSSSTLTDALAQYNDNLSWEGSPAKAVLALEAVRWLLANRAQTFADSGTSLSYEDLAKEKAKLESYVAATGTTASSHRSSFTRGRMLT